MSYQPGPLPDDPKQLPAALRREQAALQREFASSKDFVGLKTWHQSPARVFGGMVLLADGTDWDPTGGGGGLHRRSEDNTAWVRIG